LWKSVGAKEDFAMLVLRQSGDKAGAGPGRLLLAPLDPHGQGVSFAWAESTGHASGEAFEVMFSVKGRWQGPPGFAVYADWRIAPDGDSAGFVRSRRELFDLRVGAIDTFCADYLLDHADDPDCLTVLGLYGDQAGLESARNAPEIAAWAQEHPPALWGASEISGLKLFRVVAADGWP
jgi:hypothetical protein